MVLYERDGRLCRFDFRTLFHYHYVVLDMACYYFIHGYRRAETERETYDKAKRYLSADFNPSVQTFFVLFECLDIIVCEAERAHQ